MKRRLKSIILIVIVVLGLLTLRAGLSAKAAISDSKKAAAAIKAQDLNAAKAHLKDAKHDFETTQKSLYVFTPLRVVPLLGWYVADAQRVTKAAVSGLEGALTFTEAITPYSDVLGLNGQGDFMGGTAQERLAKAVETLAIVTPKIDSVGKNLSDAREQIDKIESWRYPNFLPGKPGAKIDLAKNTTDQLVAFIVDSKPLLSVLPDIMGTDKEKKYLILFQNDKELRPTGGFITAYAIFRVEKGIITSEGSSDIYKLDGTLTKSIPAPEPILKYLPNVPTLNLRDTNLSPDFKASMDTFVDLYNSTQDPAKIDGIIALDTQFVVDMVNVLGPLETTEGKFTTDKVDDCDCPQIIHELELYADQPVNYEKTDRKGIIGVLMQSMMDKAFNAPKTSWPTLLGTTIGSLREKHLLLYFFNPKTQEAVEKVNFAGRLHQYDGDYLMINESNFGGAKSNLFIKQKVSHTIKEGKDGLLEEHLTLDYKYPRKMDNCSLTRQGGLCLAGIYRDWIRIYVPKGSKLVGATSIDTPFTQTEDLDKTVIEGFFTLKPEGALKIEIDYTVPYKVEGDYKLLIQKQPGTENIIYDINAFGHKQKAFPLDTDKEFIVKP